MTTADLTALLRARFAPPVHALFTNIPNAIGPGPERTADAIAMSLWRSRGLHLHGFEIKATRADWLRELNKPEKAEAIFRFCDHWWLVAAKGVAKAEEVPPNWGWLEGSGKRLSLSRPAPFVNDAKPITREFLAALFRRAAEQSQDAQALRESFEAGRRAGKSEAARESASLRGKLQRIEDRVGEFEKTSGIRVDEHTWNAGKIGNAVRIIADGSFQYLARLAEKSREVANQADAALEEIERLKIGAEDPAVKAALVAIAGRKRPPVRMSKGA